MCEIVHNVLPENCNRNINNEISRSPYLEAVARPLWLLPVVVKARLTISLKKYLYDQK
jgi:hypothetical protein